MRINQALSGFVRGVEAIFGDIYSGVFHRYPESGKIESAMGKY